MCYFAVIYSFLCERDGENSNFFLRTMSVRCRQRFANQLCAQTYTNNRLAGINTLADKSDFDLSVKIRVFGRG